MAAPYSRTHYRADTRVHHGTVCNAKHNKASTIASDEESGQTKALYEWASHTFLTCANIVRRKAADGRRSWWKKSKHAPKPNDIGPVHCGLTPQKNHGALRQKNAIF